MAWEDGVCYLYSTGNNIQQMTSTDMRQWKYCPPALKEAPEWAVKSIKGYRGHNLSDVLVDARVGNGMINRRSGLQYAKTQKNLFAYMLKKGYISRAQYLKAVTGRTVMAIAPAFLKELVYGKILRK